jgi:hypothetical protein
LGRFGNFKLQRNGFPKEKRILGQPLQVLLNFSLNYGFSFRESFHSIENADTSLISVSEHEYKINDNFSQL